MSINWILILVQFGKVSANLITNIDKYVHGGFLQIQSHTVITDVLIILHIIIINQLYEVRMAFLNLLYSMFRIVKYVCWQVEPLYFIALESHSSTAH